MLRTMYRGYRCDDQGIITCIPGTTQSCFAAFLLHASRPGPSHDEKLEKATSEIDDILDQVRKSEPNRGLAIIATPDGLFLVWVSEGKGVEADMLRDILGTQPPPP